MNINNLKKTYQHNTSMNIYSTDTFIMMILELCSGSAHEKRKNLKKTIAFTIIFVISAIISKVSAAVATMGLIAWVGILVLRSTVVTVDSAVGAQAMAWYVFVVFGLIFIISGIIALVSYCIA